MPYGSPFCIITGQGAPSLLVLNFSEYEFPHLLMALRLESEDENYVCYMLRKAVRVLVQSRGFGVRLEELDLCLTFFFCIPLSSLYKLLESLFPYL